MSCLVGMDDCPKDNGGACDGFCGYYEVTRRVPYFRADGGTTCPSCRRQYRDHAADPVVPELTALCNGWRVKL